MSGGVQSVGRVLASRGEWLPPRDNPEHSGRPGNTPPGGHWDLIAELCRMKRQPQFSRIGYFCYLYMRY